MIKEKEDDDIDQVYHTNILLRENEIHNEEILLRNHPNRENFT